MRKYVLLAVIVMSVLAGCNDNKPAETAEEFASRVMDTAIRGWDADALYAMSSEQFRSSASIDDVREMFLHYSVLGGLKEFSTPEGQVVHEKLPDGETVELAAYQVSAEFDKDSVAVGIVVIQTESGWALYGFRINSNYVMNMIEASKRSLVETHDPADTVHASD